MNTQMDTRGSKSEPPPETKPNDDEPIPATKLLKKELLYGTALKIISSFSILWPFVS